MPEILVGRKLVFREEAVAAVAVVDRLVGGALGDVLVGEAGPHAFRAMLQVNGRKLAAVMPNVSDGLPADFVPWLCRALEVAGRSERVAHDPGADPFEVGIAVVPGADAAVGYVLEDGDEWRISAVPPADGAPLEVRYLAVLRGGVMGTIRRMVTRGEEGETARAVSELIARSGSRLEIGGFGSFKKGPVHVMEASGELVEISRMQFAPSRSLRAAVRGQSPPHRARIGGASAADWKDEARRVEAWAVAVRDLLLASGICGAPPLGLFHVDERPDSAWTDPATGQTMLQGATRVVRFVADPPVGVILARPDQVAPAR